jgi:DNA (cytosine-5)-methyltransferase 1
VSVGQKLTFGSLFSGFGGFDLGFERAGLRCAWQVEINDYASRVLAKHWPDVDRFRDVKEVGARQLRSVDVIIGGDPCQANSAAVGSGRSKKESLGGEFLRIIAEVRPRIVVRENPSHIRVDAPWPWFRFRSGLESLGYACLPFRFRACCIGARHRRERLFVLGVDANANSERMEGGNDEGPSKSESGNNIHALVGPALWPAVPEHSGHRSRSGIPAYVERITGLGNAVVPQVAEWIGRQIVQACA